MSLLATNARSRLLTDPPHYADLLHQARRLIRNRIRRYERSGLRTSKLRTRNQADEILLDAIAYESPWWNHDLLTGLAYCLEHCVDPPEYPMILMRAALVSLDRQTRIIPRDRERFRALRGDDWLRTHERGLRDTAHRIKHWPLGDCSAILTWLRFFSVLYKFDSDYAEDFRRVTKFWARIIQTRTEPPRIPQIPNCTPSAQCRTNTTAKTEQLE